jgi:8-oxo-dGTP pyrophosphatase MutT (NUDIX family)
VESGGIENTAMREVEEETGVNGLSISQTSKPRFLDVMENDENYIGSKCNLILKERLKDN